MQMNWVFVLIVSFACLAACDSKFIRPPPWNPNHGVDRDFSKNIRYRDGENISIIFESGDPTVDLYVWQMNPTNKKRGQHALVDREILSESASWKAEYDMGRYLRHGEDSVFWFGIYELGDQQTPLAESQYINVTIPDTVRLYTATVSETATSLQESPTLQLPPQFTTQPGPDTTATETPSGEERKASIGSGLTPPEVIGITVGASLGGTLVIVGIGWWFGCRKSARRGARYQQPYQWELKDREPAVYVSAPSRRIGY
ncbi:hypothetical protein BFJ63_vAg15683 [Fusarium oxysporum f. sp. narcissi]|uniref:Uncharacterized protein n=2 Tax=Fusarium oxysporum TaxID=5507 RepID=A0A4Q2VBN2_FUSOX|nr:hypothetical protein BFJ65_g7514 [Fusarium oxysporum f. sp. cepae]RKK45596.1 hypothetical protein BFJ67_g8616 [Fusarium oxysporum f. sp. cepae]RKK48803.1 hypothetical protein BFJ66_g7349 [Fusarium oxysporum f. sp. cepae]RKK84447.1 hypothetical protein BFJ71_g14564 [Fusarium oxysporum]RYC81427.1 hypothetical protein BFJ63_vAg15683 [Fusarium oxysporum f. sp. narcissi]